MQASQQRAKELRGYIKSSYFSDEEPKIEFSDPGDLAKPFRLHLEFQKAGRGFTDSASAVVGVPISELLNRLPGDFSEKLIKYLPYKRLLKPEEIAGALLYLVSPVASFVTGESIAIDGGLLCRV